MTAHHNNARVICMDEITIYPFKDFDLKGATVINGFPTAGLASAIIANYLIGALKLDQIAALDSLDFPPVSMIYDGKPKFPARIYGDEKSKIAVFLSEFTPLSYLVRPLANVMFDFIEKKKCSRIIAPEAMHIHDGNYEIYGVGSTDSARKAIDKLGIKQISHGIIAGVSGVLLNEGRRRNFDVITMLAPVKPDIPDARAAAIMIENISKAIKIKIDVEPLNQEAERIEKRIKNLREQSKVATKQSTDYHNMYI